MRFPSLLVLLSLSLVCSFVSSRVKPSSLCLLVLVVVVSFLRFERLIYAYREEAPSRGLLPGIV